MNSHPGNMKKRDLYNLAKSLGKISEDKLQKMSRKSLLSHVMDIYSKSESNIEKAKPEKIEDFNVKKIEFVAGMEEIKGKIDEEVEKITKTIEEKVEEKKLTTLTPDMPGWTDYVLSLLTEKELINGRPKYIGLKRIFTSVIGPIIKTEIRVVSAPSENNNRATVECRIQYFNKFIQDHVGNSFMCNTSDAADCFSGNTDAPFCYYPTATATTMAEARCLRKALNINVITDEEAKTPNPAIAESIQEAQDQSQLATDIQKKTIPNLCNKIGIDVNKFYAKQNINENTLSYTDAQTLINLLNSYQRGAINKGEDPPEDILKD